MSGAHVQPPLRPDTDPWLGARSSGRRAWQQGDSAAAAAAGRRQQARPRFVPPLDTPSAPSSGGGLSPGDQFSGDAGTSYRVGQLLQSRPRSTLWRGSVVADGSPVVLKLLDASSPGAAAAAARELACTRAASDAGSHLVRLLDSAQLGQLPQPAAAQQAPAPPGLVLVLQPLHQSLAWLLTHAREQQGRAGLPPAAVRSLGHSLLFGLAQLHDCAGLVHRDVKPSNLLLQQPFVARRDKLVRGMSAAELAGAHWSLVDLGSAAKLLPLPAATGEPSTRPPPSNQQAPAAGLSPATLVSSLSAWLGRFAGAGSLPPAAAAAAGSSDGTGRGVASPSAQGWQASDTGPTPYETPAYAPPEALLHLPATAAWDVWAAGCTIYEAATGRLLFPVEALAAQQGLRLPRALGGRPRHSSQHGGSSGSGRIGRSSSSSSEGLDEGEAGFELDQLHLALMAGVCGQPPPQLLRASPVAGELYASLGSGQLWLSQAELLELRSHARPLLHRLMAGSSMSLAQATELVGLLQPMLRWDPAARPTAAQLLAHPYFQPLQMQPLEPGAAAEARSRGSR